MYLLTTFMLFVIAILFLYAGFRIWWKSVENAVRSEAGHRWVGQTILRSGEWVAYHGQERQGSGFFIGRGALVLNDKELWFLMAWPRGEISIPMKAIKSISLRQEFLGRKHPDPILCVGYEADGVSDVIGWGVPDAQIWRRILVDATKRAGVRLSADPDSAAPRGAVPLPRPRA